MPDPLVAPPRIWKRLLLGAVVIVAATAAATAAAGFNELGGVVRALDQTPAPQLGDALVPTAPGKPETILLMGSDKRAGRAIDAANPPHTDTMMLARFDPQQPSIALMSIPRDLRVKIDVPGRGPTTEKINAAYSIGGPKLALKAVSSLLGIPINHLVDTNFGGFRRAVDFLGCVYVDVDHHYYNDNAGPQQYATINVPAGYQRLCGSDALDYVRYRHADSDFVRVARQQDFLREVKAQLGTSQLISDRRKLAGIFGASTETDIHSTKALLRLIELVVRSGGHSIRQVHFRATPGPSYVTSTPEQIQQVVQDFMGEKGSVAASGGPPKPAAGAPGGGQPAPRFQHDPIGGRLAAGNLGVSGLPVYYPTLLSPGATYDAGSRSYQLRDLRGRVHRAYRLAVKMASPGDYFGVEGTDWTDPPILAHPSERRTIAGRSFDLYYAGGKLRMVAWRSGRGAYWLSNSLIQALSEQEMLAIAGSTQTLGAAAAP